MSNYYVILATPGTPPAVAQKLRDDIARAVAAPDVVELFDKQGMKPTANQPADTAKCWRPTSARWTE